MSKPEVKPGISAEDEPEPKSPNIALLYALLALGLLAAMGFAWMVILPFYHRR